MVALHACCSGSYSSQKEERRTGDGGSWKVAHCFCSSNKIETESIHKERMVMKNVKQEWSNEHTRHTERGPFAILSLCSDSASVLFELQKQ